MYQKPLRVLTFTTLFPNPQQPGHGVFVRQRVLKLAKLVELRVVAPVPWFPQVRTFGERYFRYSLVPSTEVCGGTLVYHPRFPVIPRLCKTMDGAFLAAGALAFLRELRKGFPFDVIDSHWAYPDGVAAGILAGLLGVPYSITVRGDDLNVFLDEVWRRPWIRWSLRKADLVIALSHELREKAVAAGAKPERVVLVPNGINPEAFYPIDRELARFHLKLPPRGRIVLSVGRLHQSKGFPVLVDAIGLLSAKHPDVHVYIVGSPDHEADASPTIREAAARHDIRGRVHVVGPQDPDMLKYWYSAADMFCLPTSREGSANVLLEAIACGVPCITTSVGGNAYVVDTEELGILAAGEVESMARAIDIGLSRKWDTMKISQLGRRRTWDMVASECRNHLSALVDPID